MSSEGIREHDVMEHHAIMRRDGVKVISKCDHCYEE